MANQQRVIQLFTELVHIDNPSKQEQQMGTRVKQELDRLGISYREDDAGAKIGGNAGNLYAYVDGEIDASPILLSAHLDSVDPATHKSAEIHEDGTITSDGSTVLGADDLSGVAAILEAVRAVQESGLPHRPFELLFDVAEETYCEGIQQFDFASLQSREAYIFDLTGAVGTAAYQAPAIISFQADFYGRGAHAAFSPEEGLHAIRAAANAVLAVACGHVGDTTVNIGTIQGGSADNVVPAFCRVTGEVRGFDNASVQRQLSEIEKRMQEAVLPDGIRLEFTTNVLCLAYSVPKEDPVAVRFQNACLEAKLSPELIITYGGSDNNHFYHHGIRGLVVASGMNNCHSCKEYSYVEEITRAAVLAERLILSGE